jgi:hypothetical protein
MLLQADKCYHWSRARHLNLNFEVYAGVSFLLCTVLTLEFGANCKVDL